MRRREFITFIGGAATASIGWPLPISAQNPAKPLVGYLHSGSPGALEQEVAAFREGLYETGYVEGQNVAIEYRWAESQRDKLPALAADLVRRQVTVIAAIGGDSTALAAKAATSTIPIVFQIGSDAIKAGLVTSNRPGENVTGLSLFVGTVDAKRLELMHELVPHATEIALLISPLVAEAESRSRDLHDAARKMQLRLLSLSVNNEHDLDTAFATIAKRRPGALFVFGSSFFDSRRDQIVTLAARHAIPATYAWREFVVSGGLMSYGTNLTNASRQTGIYTGRILKGERPADLPVQQPTKFELVINLKTAKALGLSVPPTLLADELIE